MTYQVFLNPGDMWTGECRVGRLTTILGSCISLVVFLPSVHWLGVSHAMLPSRLRAKQGMLSGRFVDESINLFCRDLERYGATLQQCELRLYGGGDMFGTPLEQQRPIAQSLKIGEQNLHKVMDVLNKHQVDILHLDIGGNCYRYLSVDLENGQCQLNKNSLHHGAFSQVISAKAGRYDN